MCVCVYQANLRLQLNLQRLQGSLELADLTAVSFDGLCAQLHLLVQIIKLSKEREREVKVCKKKKNYISGLKRGYVFDHFTINAVTH